MAKINVRIHQGKYHKLAKPSDVSDMRCLTCNSSKGYIFKEKKDVYSWFCNNPDCIKESAKISKEIARKKALEKLAIEQKQARESRKEEIPIESPKKYKYDDFWYNKI